MTSMTAVAQEYKDNFRFCEEWEEKYQYLIDMGKTLEPLDASEMLDRYKVEGCMSQVWLVCDIQEGILTLRANSDAVIVRGIIALIVGLCQGQKVEDIACFDFEEFFKEIGLDDQLSPNRRNGLVAFYNVIKSKIS